MITSPMTLEGNFLAELKMFINFSKWSMPNSDIVSPHHLPELGFDGSERMILEIASRQVLVIPISSELSWSFLKKSQEDGIIKKETKKLII